MNTAECARYCHRNGGGAIALLDAEKAYDRARIPFLERVLHAMKFPAVFVNVITTLYKNHWARLKVNGHVGTAFRRSNGLLQGLPSSCPLWLIYVEPLLRYLQRDQRLHGCTIPGPMGRGTMTRKLGAYADDINVWCNGMQDVTYLADTDDGPIELWYQASGQVNSVEKFTIVLLGDTINVARPVLNVKGWIAYGHDDADKQLGIRIGTPEQVGQQWQRMQQSIERLAFDTAAGRRLGGSLFIRAALAKGAFASKIYHTFRAQAPYEGARNAVLHDIQLTLNTLVFGGYSNVAHTQAQQPFSDGGFDHIDISTRMRAEWALHMRELMSPRAAAWKNIWWFNIAKVYGPLCGADLPLTRCAFKRMPFDAAPSQVQQLAMEAWGDLTLDLTFWGEPPNMSEAGARRRTTARALAAYDGEPPPEIQHVWQRGARELTGAQVSQQRIFWHPVWDPQRSTYFGEETAMLWARHGLTRISDLLDGTQIMSDATFRQQFPTLELQPLHAIRLHIPPQWGAALRDGTAAVWDESCVPVDLLTDIEGDDASHRQRVALTAPLTMTQRPDAPIHKLRVRHVYRAMKARDFTTPRVFDPHAGAAARHLHWFANVDAHGRNQTISRAIQKIRHPAVPGYMSEVAFNVAFSGMRFGPNKRALAHRDTCPCGAGHAETVEHTFKDCVRSSVVWRRIADAWRAATGETKLDPTNPRTVLMGDRSAHWLDETEEAEFAGLEEPWAVIHKTTLWTIHEERNKDAAPRARPRRSAAQLLQKIETVTERLASDRWHAACSVRRSDGGRSMTAFRKRWQAPGIAAIRDDGGVKVVLFMSEANRLNWLSGTRRAQQNAPPDPLPDGTISIYTDGSAIPRKLGHPPPPAGYGLKAVTGGAGPEHADGRELYEECGQINARSSEHPHVLTTTSNLAELVAFTRAVDWAHANRLAHGKPVCIRYDSMYAAHIATGIWKAKKHKPMAHAARQAWARLKRSKEGRAWMKHVRGHTGNRWNERADRLADQGRGGKSVKRYFDG